MKNLSCTIAIIAGLLLAGGLYAQDKSTQDTATVKKKRYHTFTISNKGIYFESFDSTKSKSGKAKAEDRDKQGCFTTSIALFDLGINLLIDNTNYAEPSLSSYLHVPAAKQTKSLFDLRTGKSINVNIYPWMIKYDALKTHGQRIYISTGIGLQLYNFRYDEPISYTRNPAGIVLDTIGFKKNKLGLDYLNVPLIFTFKTRLYKDKWLVYGAGLSEGFRIASWNKQVSDERGKVKNRGSYDLADFNTCISAEVGLEGTIRVFASYQLTSLYSNALDQHPISFGFRLSGI